MNAQGGEHGNGLEAAAHQGSGSCQDCQASIGQESRCRCTQWKIWQHFASSIISGVDMNALGRKYGNSLQAASCQGHAKIIMVLLEKRVDMNAQGGQYGSALQVVLFWPGLRQLQLMKMLGQAQASKQGSAQAWLGSGCSF